MIAKEEHVLVKYTKAQLHAEEGLLGGGDLSIPNKPGVKGRNIMKKAETLYAIVMDENRNIRKIGVSVGAYKECYDKVYTPPTDEPDEVYALRRKMDWVILKTPINLDTIKHLIPHVVKGSIQRITKEAYEYLRSIAESEK